MIDDTNFNNLDLKQVEVYASRFDYYFTVSGFYNEDYFSLYFYRHINEGKTTHEICLTTDCKEFISEFISEYSTFEMTDNGRR